MGSQKIFTTLRHEKVVIQGPKVEIFRNAWKKANTAKVEQPTTVGGVSL